MHVEVEEDLQTWKVDELVQVEMYYSFQTLTLQTIAKHIFKQTRTAQAPCFLPVAFQMSEFAHVTTIWETMQHTAWESTLIERMQFSSKTIAYISIPKKRAYKNNKLNIVDAMLHCIRKKCKRKMMMRFAFHQPQRNVGIYMLT